MDSKEHIPVLVDKVVELLVNEPRGFYVDATAGTGGHSEAILGAGTDKMRLLCIDCDSMALEKARVRLKPFGERVTFIHGYYNDIDRYLADRRVDGILADLGLSSLQLADEKRGFSYMVDARLDMSMGERARSVIELLNRAGERELAEIIKRYGEERRARRIAKNIVKGRKGRPIETTFELRSIVERSIGGGNPIPSISRVFQALRIWANGELDNLNEFLRKAVEYLNPGGRLAVLSYHSLEDRMVKRFFKDEQKGCICPPDFPECVCGREKRLRILTRKVIRPSQEEIDSNPRARSARLRVAERL